MIWHRSRKLAAALAMLWLGCGPAAAPRPLPETGAPGPPPDQFSADAAWGHLTALAAVGPRSAGTAGAEKARAYLVGALRDQGLEVEEQRAQVERGGERFTTVNVVTRIPGASPDAILLVAPYDSPPEGKAGVDAGASGAALLVELARALGARQPVYTVWIALVEGDSLAAAGSAARAEVGSGAFAGALAKQGHLDRIRLAVYFDRVSRPQLRVARDLTSLRSAREDFWVAARRAGQGAVFPPDAALESVDDGHRALLDAGLRRTLAVSGSRVDASATAGDAASAPPDDLEHASRESLGAVGAVSLEALSAISARLAKIDRFVKSPIEAARQEPGALAAPPAPEEAAPGAEAVVPPAPETAPTPTREEAGVAPEAAVGEGGAQADDSR